MDKHSSSKQSKSTDKHSSSKQSMSTAPNKSEEVSSIEWECNKMTEQEEDLIYRMYKLVGNRWELIAGRIPGRTPEEIERFWIMRHREEGLAKKKY